MYNISSLLRGLKAAGTHIWLAVCFIVGISMVPAAIMVDTSIDCAIWCDGRLSPLHRLRQPIAVGITMAIWLLVVLRLVRPLVTGLCVCRHPMWSPEVSDCASFSSEPLDSLEITVVLVDSCLIALECLASLGLRAATVVCGHVLTCVVGCVILAFGSRCL
jgi:hypothetical protein